MMVTHSIRHVQPTIAAEPREVTRRCDVMYDLDMLTQLEADS
jgi:hypothetical protein